MEKLKRNTVQKLLIKEFLYNNKSHPTAYDIYKAVKNKIPTISFATVYNNLKSMVLDGELIEIITDDKKRFDPDISLHDHFICIKCKNIIDIPKTVKNIDLKDFKVISYTTYIKGICNKCLKK